MAVIYVDLDGTLTKETEGFGDKIFMNRTPRKKKIRQINEIREDGHQIIIWTARLPEDLKVTIKWLEKHGVKYDGILLNKPMFDLYVCDKALNVEDLHKFTIE